MKFIYLAAALMAIGTAAYAQAPQSAGTPHEQALQALLNAAHQQSDYFATQAFQLNEQVNNLNKQLSDKVKELAAAHSAPEAAPSK